MVFNACLWWRFKFYLHSFPTAFFLDFQKFLKPTKTTVTSTRFDQKHFLVEKKHYWFEPLHGSICLWSAWACICLCVCVYVVCECIRMYTVKSVVLYLYISVHSCYIYVTKGVCVFVLACVCVCWMLWVSRVGQKTLMWLTQRYFIT